MLKKKKYSVLLLRPDYMAATFGQDTYYAHVEATSVKRAIKMARRDAAKTDDAITLDDYFVLLTLEGHRNDVTGKYCDKR